jgi:hypothetical protein
MRYLLACSIVLACTPDPTSPDSGDDADGVTHESFYVELYSAFCDASLRCEPLWGPTFPDKGTCQQSFAAQSAPLDPELYAIDPEAAAACIAKARNQGCDQFFFASLDPDCRQAALGQLRLGDCCDARGGCATGPYCSYQAGSDTLGKCKLLGTEGDGCVQDTDCAEAFYCDPNVSQCVAYAAVGDSCAERLCTPGYYCGDALCRNPKNYGDTCNATDPFECGVFSCVEGHCRERPLVNDVCNTEQDCPPGAHCVGPDFPGICRPAVLNDQPCDPELIEHADCASAFTFGLVCNTDGFCEQLPQHHESCETMPFCFPFEEVYCDYVAQSCLPRVAVGNACVPDESGIDFNDPCVYDALCDPQSETCEGLGGPGPQCD